MRIIAGERRGHKFDGPADSLTRPTSDMVRESIFNILADRPDGRTVYDLFAGTGALGLEALSRGASFSLFIEKDRRNLGLIKRNIATLRYEGSGSILGADAYRWVQTFAPEDDEPVLVLIDPPYREIAEKPERVRAMLVELIARLPAGSTIMLESESDPEEDVLPDRDSWDIRKYGGTQVAFLDLGDRPANNELTAGDVS
jgi:16S rRNA (guanine966-N2)-methyltransferase